MGTPRTRRSSGMDPDHTAEVVPLPGLGAPHSELAREASVTRWTKVHGHDVAYRQAGSGPLLVMIHGIAGSSGTWVPAMPLLAERFTVIAPDLLGHGESSKPRGDYSLGAYASGIRDLLGVLGHDRATIVGHSLGGGIAMQFAYQFPTACERLVLVDSGGLGREVSPALRAATLPGAEFVIPLLFNGRTRRMAEAVRRRVGWLPLGFRPGVAEVGRGLASLSDTHARTAFVHTARGVIDVRGQRVDARDRLYLAGALPTMVVWGARDRVIPADHGIAAHAAMPGSRLELFERAGHFPHAEEPARFARVLLEFIEQTSPAEIDQEQVQGLLAAEGAPS